jgi:hypothetical protein
MTPLIVDGDNGQIISDIKTDRIELRTRAGTTSVSVLQNSVEITSATSVVIQTTLGTITVPANGIVDINGNFTVNP